MTRSRLASFPASPFFAFAAREIDAIYLRIDRGPPIDRAFYDSLNIGLMCARELEPTDPEYCDLVYAMLEQIRLATEA